MIVLILLIVNVALSLALCDPSSKIDFIYSLSFFIFCISLLIGSIRFITISRNSFLKKEISFDANVLTQTSIDLQQAIQKSVAEAIERVSLEAQVEGLTAQKEALVAQVSALENQVAGVQAQLQAGAESAAGKWTANIVPKAEQNEADLYYYSTRKGTRSTGWKNGPNIDLTNATEEAVTFTFTKEGDGWLQLPPTTTVQSGETKKVSFGPSGNKALNGKRRRKKDYNGNVKVQAAGETITFNYKNKHHRG